MDVIEFCSYIREQKTLFDNNRPNDFRLEEDPELKRQYPDRPDIYNRYRIYATIFVDEYYYDRDPISGEVRSTLWKEFINQPNRTMHILCDTDFSADGDSSTTGSVVTIRQHSIQSIFDTTNEELSTAWGGETSTKPKDTSGSTTAPNATVPSPTTGWTSAIPPARTDSTTRPDSGN